MTKFKILVLLSCFVLVFSCKNNPKNPSKEGDGILALSMDFNNTTNIVNKTKAPSNDELALYILNSSKDTVHKFIGISNIPDEITLKFGKYTAICESIDIDRLFSMDKPIYRGEQPFEIALTQKTEVKLTVKYADILVSAEYTDKFKELVSSYGLSITSDLGGTVEIPSTETRTAYVKVNDFLNYTLKIVDDLGNDVIYNKKIEGLKPADFLKLKFDVAQASGEGNNTTLRIYVDMTLNEVTHTFEMLINPGVAPKITPENFTEGVTIPVTDGELTKAKIKIEPSNPLFGIYINSNTDLFTNAGLDKKINILALSEKQKQQLTELGLNVNDITTNIYPVRPVSNPVTVDLSELSSRLAEGEHLFTVSVVDVNFLNSQIEMKFDAAGNPVKMGLAKSYDIYRSDLNGTKVIINGFYTSKTAPEGLTFKYKTVSSEEWTVIDPSRITVNTTAKTFTITDFLPQNNTLTIKAVTKVGDLVTDGSGETSVTTSAIPAIPNLNFDTWTKSGKNWYPNADASNSYWGTGNEGVTMNLVGKDPNTVPEETLIVKGKAARMVSISVPVVNFAAGNLFVGSYKTNISDPISSVKFGRPFIGRPDQMKGYYLFKPAGYNGGNDYCHIYIKLENRNSGVTVGYGEFVNNTQMSAYEPFTIDVKYSSSLPVTHVTVCATSSKDGQSFNGGVGSTLYVDEFEIIYNGK